MKNNANVKIHSLYTRMLLFQTRGRLLISVLQVGEEAFNNLSSRYSRVLPLPGVSFHIGFNSYLKQNHSLNFQRNTKFNEFSTIFCFLLFCIFKPFLDHSSTQKIVKKILWVLCTLNNVNCFCFSIYFGKQDEKKRLNTSNPFFYCLPKKNAKTRFLSFFCKKKLNYVKNEELNKKKRSTALWDISKG